ncbi:hypothetical protein LSAT2_017701 [Lamellibrachia satsuma]|nr:hypothetical protein LSAT2_017701 [Lamellibrachia satsuma]
MHRTERLGYSIPHLPRHEGDYPTPECEVFAQATVCTEGSILARPCLSRGRLLCRCLRLAKANRTLPCLYPTLVLQQEYRAVREVHLRGLRWKHE